MHSRELWAWANACNRIAFSHIHFLALLNSLAILVSGEARAQLVDDGTSLVLNGVNTNLPSDLIVGTNDPLTLLTFTNGATVSSSGHGYIGYNETAISNSLVVTGTNSAMNITSNLVVGWKGAGNQMTVSDGARVTSSYANIGFHHSSSNNYVLVSGPDSLWTNSTGVYLGVFGSDNQMVISNGGTVASKGGGSLCNRSSVLVTGTGSVWKSYSRLSLGVIRGAGGNELIVSNGGAIVNSHYCNIGSNSSSNRLVVTGPGTVLSNSLAITVGFLTNGNELVISDGATVTAERMVVGVEGSSGNRVTVTGPKSTLANQGDLILGANGSSSNTLFLSDGGTIADDAGSIGLTQVQSGNKAVVSGALWTNRSNFIVGAGSPSCQLLVTNGGAIIVSNWSCIGRDQSSRSNLVVVSGTNAAGQASSWSTQWLHVGSNGPCNQLIISNYASVTALGGFIGHTYKSYSNKVIVTSGGSLGVRGNLTIGGTSSQGNEMVVSDGGNLTVSGWLNIGRNAVTNKLTVGNSGTVHAARLDSGGTSGQVIVDGGCLFITNTTDSTFGTIILISGRFRTEKLSLSSYPLSGLAFNGGKFQSSDVSVATEPLGIGDGNRRADYEMLPANPPFSYGRHVFRGGLFVSSNAMLTGVGTIVGNVTNLSGGSILPGSSTGQITIEGNLVLHQGSRTVMDLDADTGLCDMIVVTTNLEFGGTLEVTNVSGTLTNGSVFQLFDATNYSGMFSSILPTSPGLGLRWNMNGLNVDGKLRVASTTSPPPTVSSVTLSDNQMVIRVGNGLALSPVVLLSSTNLLAPITNWIPMATNLSDAFGNATFSNTLLKSESERFFRLRAD